MLIDEAWHLVGRPETGEYANDLARRARHLGLVLIVMCQQLSDFDTEHGLALLQNSTMQLLLAQHPNEIPFIRDALQLSDREAASSSAAEDRQGQPRPDAVDQRHPRPRPRRAARRPDRVLGLHLRPEPRSRSATPRSPGTTATRGRRSPRSPARHPRAPRRPAPRDAPARGGRDSDERRGSRRRPPPRPPASPDVIDRSPAGDPIAAAAPRRPAARAASRRSRGRARAAAGGLRPVRRRGREHVSYLHRAARARRRAGARARVRHRRPDRRARRLRRRATRALAARGGRAASPPVCRPAACTRSRRGRRCACCATGPRLHAELRPRRRRAACSSMRARAHALTVVDCGTLPREADRLALAHASHVAWVLPATRAASRRARARLDAVAPDPPGRELLVARRDARAAQGRRCATLQAPRRATRRHADPASPTCPACTRRDRRRARAAAGRAAGDPRGARAMTPRTRRDRRRSDRAAARCASADRHARTTRASPRTPAACRLAMRSPAISPRRGRAS